MDKIYSAQDIVNVIAKVEELAVVNAELEELLYRGSNDERLVDKKIELQKSLMKFRSSELVSVEPIKIELDEDSVSLKADYDFVVLRYKQRKIELETLIRSYTNGNSD